MTQTGEGDLVASHPLMYKWVLWELKPGNKDNWTESLRQIASFDSVEGFWKVHDNSSRPSSLAIGSDYYLFREGIQPNWEDDMNAHGGRWQAILPSKQYVSREKSNENLDNCWLELEMSVIGAQYEADNRNICGVAAYVRRNQDKVAMWISDASDESALERIGQLFKIKFLSVDVDTGYGKVGTQFTFDKHADSFRRYAIATHHQPVVQSPVPTPEAMMVPPPTPT